jgi:DNA-binding CsgD family transcriptional regulator
MELTFKSCQDNIVHNLLGHGYMRRSSLLRAASLAGKGLFLRHRGAQREIPALDQANLEVVNIYAAEISALGREIGLPFIAVSADISSPDPMIDATGRPYAETVFQWADPELKYWNDRAFALKAPFVLAARYMAEPFYFGEGRFGTWRPTTRLDVIEAARSASEHGIACAIVSPTFVPGGVIGVVVWASANADIDVAAVFENQAAILHAAALRFVSAYHDARGNLPSYIRGLTRREIQCLKWAAAGKTDSHIAELVRIATPTVRFHLKNAAAKLGVAGRSQAVREAAALGYVGLDLNPRGKRLRNCVATTRDLESSGGKAPSAIVRALGVDLRELLE